MKFLILKTLLLRKRKDEGFTLPIVIAIGLVMVLLSAVNLVQSGEENLNALSQQGSSDALAAAEIGIARYRNLLNNNRVLTVYNLDTWTNAWVTGQACDSISSTGGGWADNSATGWRNITVAGNTIGSYRIDDYIYDNDDNLGSNNNNDIDLVSDANNDIDGDGESDARGLLTVRGKDVAATEDGSITQIQVEIPLGVNTQDLVDLNPAIWIVQNDHTAVPSITNFGTVDVNGANVVLYQPSGEGDCIDPPDLGGENTISDSRNLPPLATIPNPTGLTKKNTLNSNITLDPHYNSGELLLGTLSDVQNTSEGSHVGDDRYYFEYTGDLNLDNEDIITDGTARVIIYVSGNLTISNAVNITNSSNAATSRFLEIHVGGNVTINGSGNVNIKGLIHAPGGTVTMSGNGNVNVTGSIFANDWNNTRTGTIIVNADDYTFYSITPNRTPAPLTFRPSGWQTQEAD
ncbi:conserved hypothetical protein [Hyella patelloides LEGE 07179]|uniref:DUF7305 domain-containing protein n=1 Tax=Hyella patelloides LEGE 07179 TaxID=945734 RepID=A0A563VTF9_9CYAN|nr:hypothetical protein [Hyella patelloides]VEP14727.1 conserved hypothetical protein [Hyella patelloides LEGE 07179]